MLVLTRRIGEAIVFTVGNEKIVITTLGIQSQKGIVRLGIDANPDTVHIVREELIERDRERNGNR